MDELIDIVDEKGRPTGKAELKSVIHKEGYYHNTAHLWIYTEDGRILLQQRSASKAICPLLWDVSVAGHIDSGETPEQAAVREAQEEIGIDLSEDQLNKIGVFSCFQSYDNGIHDNEFHNTYIAKTNWVIKDFSPDLEEVEALKFVTISEFKTLLKHSDTNSHFVSSNYAYYMAVLDAISKQL